CATRPAPSMAMTTPQRLARRCPRPMLAASGEYLAADAGQCEIMQLILTSSLFQDWFVLSALLLLTIPFWSSGLFKLANISAALDEAEQLGLKPPLLVVIATILVQLAGSLLVVT